MKLWVLPLLAFLTFAAIGAIEPGSKGKILLVVSSTDSLRLQNGKTVPTGYYLGELAVPAQRFIEAGYAIVVANPGGNKPAMDQRSKNVSYFANDQKKFKQAVKFVETFAPLQQPRRLRDVVGELDQFAAVYVPGGHAPMNDLAQDSLMGDVLRHFHKAGKPTAFLCHGPIATLSALPLASQFYNAMVKNDKSAATNSVSGWPYVGYRMTIFSNSEETVAEEKTLKGKVPYRPADALTIAGGKVENGPDFKPFVVQDRELITGQNPASDHELAETVLKALENRPKS